MTTVHPSTFGLQAEVLDVDLDPEWRALVSQQACTLAGMLQRLQNAVAGVRIGSLKHFSRRPARPRPPARPAAQRHAVAPGLEGTAAGRGDALWCQALRCLQGCPDHRACRAGEQIAGGWDGVKSGFIFPIRSQHHERSFSDRLLAREKAHTNLVIYITALCNVFFYACGLNVGQEFARGGCASRTLSERGCPPQLSSGDEGHCEEKGDAIMERSCTHCDHPDSSLLRIVLIGEIIRADEATLYTMAEIFQSLGLLELSDEDDVPEVEPVVPGKGRPRLVK